jgi:hypothetical protein
MVILLTAAALSLIGAEISLAVWPRRAEGAPGLFERITMAATIAATLWLGTTWILALLRQLTYGTLVGRAVLFAAIALVLAVRRLRTVRFHAPKLDGRMTLLIAVLLLPLLFWVELMLWRGAIIPPLSHDALSYHLPKAVLFSRAHGFEYLKELDPRQRNIPANYEIFLTEFVTTQHSDTYTEWPSMAFYLLLAIACVAIAERWWGKNVLAGLVVMIFVAGIPVLLLHSGAHKNDTLVAFFSVAAMVFAGRWLRNGEYGALLLLIASIAMGLGTKPQIAGLAFFLTPFVLVRLFRDFNARKVAAIVLFGIVAFLILGGAVYVTNIVQERAVIGKTGAIDVISYGDWRNLWQGPYVLLAAPFASNEHELPVPWEEQPWFWQRYEIYFSHLGIPFALCALIAPFAAWRLRRGEGSYERWAITFAALAAFALLLPVVFQPHGMFAISLPRYALFLVPVVFGWTIAPAARCARGPLRGGLIAIAVVAFVLYGIDNALEDRFVPLDYVIWAKTHPGTRIIPFDPARSGSVLDRMAGPNDKVAFDATYASWIQPVFGPKLSRPVYFIPPGDGPPVIPDDAKWVVIDRSFNIVWGSPAYKDLSQTATFMHTGVPTPEDLRVRRALLRDKRFKLVYFRKGANQLIFQRVR